MYTHSGHNDTAELTTDRSVKQNHVEPRDPAGRKPLSNVLMTEEIGDSSYIESRLFIVAWTFEVFWDWSEQQGHVISVIVVGRQALKGQTGHFWNDALSTPYQPWFQPRRTQVSAAPLESFQSGGLVGATNTFWLYIIFMIFIFVV